MTEQPCDAIRGQRTPCAIATIRTVTTWNVRHQADAPVQLGQRYDIARQDNMSRCQDMRGATTGPPARHGGTTANLVSGRAVRFSLDTHTLTPGSGRYTLTTLRHQLAEEGRGCFYTAEQDPNSESDSYEPTRECFNIDGAVATTDDTQDAAAGARAPVAMEDPRTPRNDGQVYRPPQDDKAMPCAAVRA
jgi:urease beta subunit